MINWPVSSFLTQGDILIVGCPSSSSPLYSSPVCTNAQWFECVRSIFVDEKNANKIDNNYNNNNKNDENKNDDEDDDNHDYDNKNNDDNDNNEDNDKHDIDDSSISHPHPNSNDASTEEIKNIKNKNNF